MMKKVKLTETDLNRIVNKVINEQRSEKEIVAMQLQRLLYMLPPKTWLGDVKEYFSSKSMEEINDILNQINDLALKYKSFKLPF